MATTIGDLTMPKTILAWVQVPQRVTSGRYRFVLSHVKVSLKLVPFWVRYQLICNLHSTVTEEIYTEVELMHIFVPSFFMYMLGKFIKTCTPSTCRNLVSILGLVKVCTHIHCTPRNPTFFQLVSGEPMSMPKGTRRACAVDHFCKSAEKRVGTRTSKVAKTNSTSVWYLFDIRGTVLPLLINYTIYKYLKSVFKRCIFTSWAFNV